MRAWGYGECRILPISIPGTVRSSVYLPPPVVFSAASIIAVGFPMMLKLLCILGTRYSRLGSDCRSAAIAERIAAYIWLYPVQRQRLLLKAMRTSASDGSGFSARNHFTVMMNPGVQKPHCAPPQSP